MSVKNACRVVVREQAALGEGVIWDAARRTAHYVDIERGLIHSVDPATGVRQTAGAGGMVGCVVPGPGGVLRYPLDAGLYSLWPATGETKKECSWEIPAFLRFNDGKCDSRGRLWVGAMAVDQTDPRAKGGGKLYCYTARDGLYTVLDGLTIPNGLAWNPENTQMYHIDTPTGQVTAYDYNADMGTISHPRTVVSIPANEGAPDGMAIDTEGMLWIAHWGGYQVARYNPKDGSVLQRVPVPAKNVSCCAFGGKALNDLFITTAMDEKGQGGELYCVKAGVRGYVPWAMQ